MISFFRTALTALALGCATLPAAAFDPDRPLIGRNVPEKIAFGTLFWAMHLVSDMAGSSSNPGKGTGIPGVVLSLLKELSSLPVFQDMQIF